MSKKARYINIYIYIYILKEIKIKISEFLDNNLSNLIKEDKIQFNHNVLELDFFVQQKKKILINLN